MDGIVAEALPIDAVPGQARVDDGGSPPSREWRVLHRLEKGRIGKRHDDGSVSVRRRERADTILFGPFWRLPCGSYRLTFRCHVWKPRLVSQPVLGAEIIIQNRLQQAWRDFTTDELALGEAAIEFEVPPELSLEGGEEARYEFRLIHLHNADLTIDRVDLRQLDEGEIAPLLPRRWRLLGRQWLTPRGRRVADGTVVFHRRAPVGTVLHGGRPYLWLPEAVYRLKVRGRAVARAPGAPAVAVEIVARPWSGRSGTRVPARESVLIGATDFTGAELMAASSVEFVVPRELSLESGDDVPFEFNLSSLYGAATAIESVELHELRLEPPDVPIASRWRLAGWLSGGRNGAWTQDGVRVRREDRPGAVLAGSRPRLRLNPGRYHLSVGATAEHVRDPAQPVLGLEVAARLRASPAERLPWRRWERRRAVSLLRRVFTAAELSGGPVEAEFVLPEGLVGGDHAYCEIRVDHFGNADLSIETAELNEVQRTGARSRPAIGMARRRNVLVIGNCQAETVRQGFERAEPLRARFKAKYQFIGLQKQLHQRGIEELREADLILVQDIKDWQAYPLKEFIPEGIEIVQFPLLHFASLWPFDHYNGPGDKEAYDREWPNLTFLYQDGLLARLRREIPDREARFAAYRGLNIDGIVNYVRLHDFERRRLSAMDRRFGGEIGKYVLDNFQSRQLFYTIAHPNRQILSMLMQRLMGLLGIDEPFPFVSEFDHLKRLQVPVHPKVASALGVGWADERTEYLYEGRPTTWEAYTRAYINHYG
jgi:hypothetical protein